ncbi:MAG: enoyl-CoA hydratase/isomerase family protein [Armatimonadetes bacterium]|nr:enoyl-CoA hydratase/isomerase family protein [Armatimonadota bacterium]
MAKLVTYQEAPAGVGLLTLDDPGRLNAMSEEMAVRFEAQIDELRAEPPRVLILTGAGRAFSAGGDLEMLRAKHKVPVEKNRKRMLAFYRSFLSMLELEVPLIAAVNGHAVGAGLCLACACDLRLADPAARFSAPFTRLGLFPGMGATYFLPRILGPTWTRDLLLTGRLIGAGEALQIRLVSQISEAQGIVELARRAASQIMAGGREAAGRLLLQLREPAGELQQALEAEARAQAESYRSPEFQEGLRKALEPRRATAD